ncbi:ATP-binding cassette domain-containing protein [Diaminobutyricimonas sp. TR449]|uniref:ABC transporter ATP-binding protein n=1 Tax=Diaminobutyricimonas sp. TR449 TaxID=2708076 RepID=UPI00141FB65F|nr:ATP-binding cassette domain-containing protein [Diaminobutyricimonas sp. TR449]
MTALELHNVYKNYGGPPVVQDVSLSVQEGQTVAIIGPNGAGKTTLFGVMAGEHRATKGALSVFGKDATRAGASRLTHMGVARTFQVARYFLEKTVEQNVVIARDAHKTRYRNPVSATPRSDESVTAALEAVGLEERRHQSSSTLSHGDRKSLEIAMALAQDPAVLLLDEPTAGMGTEDIPRTIRLLKGLRESRPNLTVVITAHDMEVVFALADRVVLMANGRIALEGEPAAVRDDPITREIYLGNSYEAGV